MYVVDASGGAPTRLTKDATPCSQPGRRQAGESSTGQHGGQRDIYTIAPQAARARALTNDAAVDWSPAWSPDGRYVYFASDRGGAMNLWRIAVDQANGTPKAQPEPVTNGVQASAALPRFSATGAARVPLTRQRDQPRCDSIRSGDGTAGAPRVLDGSNNIRMPSDVSPDGREIALYSIGESQEDMFLSGIDGSGMHRLTDDPPRDRAPMFTSDGKSVVFYSNRGGNWGGWTMHLDGSGLRSFPSPPGGFSYPTPSPVDDRVVFSEAFGARGSYILTLSGNAPLLHLPGMTLNGGTLLPTTWSPDGKTLAGSLTSDSGHPVGVAVYDIASHLMTVISEDEAAAVRWVPHSGRIVYFRNDGTQLVMLDTVTKQRTMVPVQLPGPATNDVFAISRDGRTIYYGAVRAQSDIWVAENK